MVFLLPKFGIMYDKVKLWCDRSMVGEQFPTIAYRLDNAREETDLHTGEVKIFGNLEGLKVGINAGGLFVYGSLAKYLYGSNVYPLDRRTTDEAMEKLSDGLCIPISDARVLSLEFGTTFLMKHPVADYLERLGEMPRLSRGVFGGSLYYQGKGKDRIKPKVFTFYDKEEEARKEGGIFPEFLEGKNLLRYEMRLNKRVPQQLNTTEVRASTLSDKAFYRGLVGMYQRNYFAIRKTPQIITNAMDEIRTAGDAVDLFVARLINQIGQPQIGEYLEELKKANVFADRKSYSRVKKRIQDIAAKANITSSNELIRELDDEIRNCGAYV